MLLQSFRDWAPFRLDALGLVTLLGASEIDIAVGRLVRNRFSEGLPLLGAFLIASNAVTKPIPGFVAYNVTDGIMATDVTGWFARWLLSQELTWNSTGLFIRVEHNKASPLSRLIVYLTTLLTIGPVFALALLVGDWWGVANAVSMAASVLVRRVIVRQNCKALDIAAERAGETSAEPVITFWTLPTGHALTIIAPRGVLLDCLLTTPKPPFPRSYLAFRWIGWAAFGCHVITLGMTCLACQILSVALLLAATILVANRFGDNEYKVGKRISIERSDHAGGDFRAAAYARMCLSTKEERSLVAWNLVPHESNTTWWKKYRKCQNTDETTAFNNWNKILGDAEGV